MTGKSERMEARSESEWQTVQFQAEFDGDDEK